MPKPGRGQVTDLLTHYLRTAFIKAGATWDSDNYTEVKIIVDGIEHMIADAIKTAIGVHTETAPHIHADGSTA